MIYIYFEIIGNKKISKKYDNSDNLSEKEILDELEENGVGPIESGYFI